MSVRRIHRNVVQEKKTTTTTLRFVMHIKVYICIYVIQKDEASGEW